MPVNPTYPGIYIEELPSNARTITAAPTSITVFVGYTHPFKTLNFGRAVRIGNFTEYEREFGGLYASGVVENEVAYAVNQFFLNGGSDAYVVGLEARYRDGSGNPVGPNGGAIGRPAATIGGVVFSAQEPTDLTPMTVTINNLRPSPSSANDDMADIIVAYGTRVETFRGVSINTDPANASNFIEERIGTQADPTSTLVTVAPNGGNYGVAFTAATQTALVSTTPAGFVQTFSAADFVDVFEQDSSLDKVPVFNLLLTPGVADNSVWSNALAFAERKRAFVILDPPANASADSTFPGLSPIDTLLGTIPKSANGALYFPYLESVDPLTGAIIEQPPSGYVAGIFARTDLSRGVWKAPAGLETTVRNTTALVDRGVMADFRHGILNPQGVNVLRSFPGIGTVVFGARTLVTANPAFQQWRYVPVRRMALFIEQTLYSNLGWVVFEPNDEPLWVAIRTSIENFMLGLFNQGAFQGSRPSQAFLVQCDSTTTTQTDIDNGIVNILVGFRPLKPAEFVIIKIAQLAGQAQS